MLQGRKCHLAPFCLRCVHLLLSSKLNHSCDVTLVGKLSIILKNVQSTVHCLKNVQFLRMYNLDIPQKLIPQT